MVEKSGFDHDHTHCIKFSHKTVHSFAASLHPGVKIETSELLGFCSLITLEETCSHRPSPICHIRNYSDTPNHLNTCTIWGPVQTAPEKFENRGCSLNTHHCFLSTQHDRKQQLPVILDSCLKKTQSGKSPDHCGTIVFENLCFQNVLCVHKNSGSFNFLWFEEH